MVLFEGERARDGFFIRAFFKFFKSPKNFKSRRSLCLKNGIFLVIFGRILLYLYTFIFIQITQVICKF